MSCTLSGSPRSRKNRIASSRGHICRSYTKSPAAISFIFFSIASRSSGTNGRGDDEVVEEAFVGWRTDAALHRREELRHGRRQQVRRAVAINRQRLRILVRENPDARVFLERIRQIDDPVVHHPRVGGLREARRYRRGDFANGRGAWHRFRGAVREGDGELGQLETKI